MNEEQREILGIIFSVIGAGLLVTSAVVMPNILIGIAFLVGRRSHHRESARVHRILRYASRKKWIQVRETKHGIQVLLTSEGRRKWQEVELRKPLPTHRWDRQWRVVIFDIPDKKKLARETLRRTLRELGFAQLQESVWVTPYECRSQITAARQLYGIGLDLKLITATHIEEEEQLKHRFNLLN